MHRRLSSRCQWIARAAFLALICLGCTPQKPVVQPEASLSASGPDLTLVVVDDPQMSAAIERLGAEWKARTGGALAISQARSLDVERGDTELSGADAVVYPSRLLGTLVEREQIVPLPAEATQNRELAWNDTFELLQIVETTWGRQPYAVPFGSPVLTLYVRRDLLEALRKETPRDWTEYHELADLLGRRENLRDTWPPADSAWHGSLQPLAQGWAGRVLLARAAPYVKHRDHYSALFDIETMEPLLAGDGFVRALEELLADYQKGPPEQIEMDPAAVRAAFLSGQAALAIAWPGHAGEAPARQHVVMTFAELPGASVAYNFADKTWERRPAEESVHLPLLGSAGRLGSIGARSTRPQAAFQLLAWLSGREWGTRVASASEATTLYRRSQIRDPQPWVDTGTDAAAASSYAATVQAALGRQQYLSVPRIPGEAEYMAALDVAVHQVLKLEKSPREALSAAAASWREITDRRGRDHQKAAYRASLGFEQ